ncbi:MAG: phosphate starvation-inducible protein PhoH, partial [Alistipes sp.]|nr:phosphate starvation-inducible protein PhoH [Alistipes sp.]
MEAINKEILIEGVDPRELYGAQDAYLELMRELSPKVKIVARGSALKALGAKRDVESFERKMNSLVEYYQKYGHISREVVTQAFSTGLSDCAEPVSDKDTIVFGNNGNIIRARTVNQRRLVELYEKND